MIVTKDDQDNDDRRDFDGDGGDDAFFCRDSTWCQFSEQLSSHLLYGGMYSENRHIANNSSNTDYGSSTSSCSSRYHFFMLIEKLMLVIEKLILTVVVMVR